LFRTNYWQGEIFPWIERLGWKSRRCGDCGHFDCAFSVFCEESHVRGTRGLTETSFRFFRSPRINFVGWAFYEEMNQGTIANPILLA
jgi:hypothetical protein